jgi:hypothetical protein
MGAELVVLAASFVGGFAVVALLLEQATVHSKNEEIAKT